MKELAEATWYDNSGDEQKEVREQVYLLHFGLHSEIVDIDGTKIGITNTTAICQNIKTGQLEMFDPSQLRIIGTDLKK